MQIKHTKNYIPDYPRPRLTRKQWTSLNGEWRFAEGKRQSFADCERTINVPFAPECKLSGIDKLIEDGYVTYAKKINLIKRGRILLHFEGIDYKTSLFVNGTFVAENEMVDNKEIKAFVNDVCQYTRSVDTRFVISNDGWEHTVSDLLTVHQYEQNADRFYDNYSFQQTIEGSPLNNRKPYCKGYKYGGQPILFTEFGGCSFKRDLTADAWGYGDAVENELEFTERLNGLISVIESMDFCSGWCYTQFTDVQQEVNGLLTEDRRFKLPLQTVNKIVRKKQL